MAPIVLEEAEEDDIVFVKDADFDDKSLGKFASRGSAISVPSKPFGPEEVAVQRDERLLGTDPEIVWKDICAQFFYSSRADTAARVIMEIYEYAKVPSGLLEQPAGEIDAINPTLDEIEESRHHSLTTDARAQHGRNLSAAAIVANLGPVLSALGFTTEVYEGTNLFKLTDEKIQCLEEWKNAVRSRFHADKASQQYAMFQQMLESQKHSLEQQHMQDPVLGSSVQRFESDDELRREQVVQGFVRKYAESIGVHPFFHGIRQLLSMHQDSAFTICWTLNDVVLVESAGGQFSKDAVNLLMDGLAMSVGPLQYGSDGSLIHKWFTSPMMTQRRFTRRILGRLPRPSRLEGKATGAFDVTTTPQEKGKSPDQFWFCNLL